MTFSLDHTPYDAIGGERAVRALVKRFYDVMEAREPSLTATHRRTEDGRLHPDVRERFGLFLIGWLGGPQTYTEVHGHPRLRMRHRNVPIDEAMRDAWLRCMGQAMDDQGVDGELRQFLDERFAHVADFLRNVPG